MNVFTRCLPAIIYLITPVCVPAADAEARPLSQAHAHNDYRHERPLEDALEHGFCSVEADVFLVDNKLLVAHSYLELNTEKSLVSLYIEPLVERVRANGGKVYPEGPEFTLMVDIKASGEAVYAALHAELAKYPDVFSSVQYGLLKRRAVRVIISGDRPIEAIEAEKIRFAAIDGRLTDLDSKRPTHLMPLISDRWSSHFRWRGKGPMPLDERAKLQKIVSRAHRAGRRVRFWGTPDDPIVWKELKRAKVDLMNADDLDGLREFLSGQ